MEGEREERTLSVSIVATSSSNSTYSPFFFNHCFKVPSEIDSAIAGTLIVSSAVGGYKWVRISWVVAVAVAVLVCVVFFLGKGLPRE